MITLKSFGRIAAVVALVFAAVSCNTTSNDPESDLNLIPVNSVTVDGYKISLFAEKTLETGANELFWKIEQDGEVVHPQSFSITPMMDMGEMMHSTPFDQPATLQENDQYMQNMAVFIMPGGEMGSWFVEFELETQTGETISGSVPIDVVSSWRLTSVKDSQNRIYFITWYAPDKPVSGNNELTFLVHTRNTMMDFPPVSDAEMVVYPYMDMGGGSGHSTDFTPPVATGNGFYEGDINYSMSGVWTTSVELTIGDETLPEVVFEYSVQAK